MMFFIFLLMLSSQTTKEMIARSCATIVTHPFHGKCNTHTLFDYQLNHFNSVNSLFSHFSHKHFYSSDHTQMHGPVHWKRSQIQVSPVFPSCVLSYCLCIVLLIYLSFCCLISYSGVFDSIITIYREEGILGFFA